MKMIIVLKFILLALAKSMMITLNPKVVTLLDYSNHHWTCLHAFTTTPQIEKYV